MPKRTTYTRSFYAELILPNAPSRCYRFTGLKACRDFCAQTGAVERKRPDLQIKYDLYAFSYDLGTWDPKHGHYYVEVRPALQNQVTA